MIKKNLLQWVPESKKAIAVSAMLKVLSLTFSILIIFNFVDLILNRKFSFSILVLISVKVFLTYLNVIQVQKISGFVKSELRSLVNTKVFSLSAFDLQKIPRSKISQVSTEGIEHLDSYYSLYLPQFIYSMLAPILLFIVLSQYNFKISLVLFVAVPMIPFSIVLVQKIAKKILSKYWNTYTNLGDSFLENVQGLGSLKIFSADQFKAKEMKEEAEVFRKTTMRVLLMQLNSISMMDLFAYGGSMFALVLAVNAYYTGQVDLKAALLFTLLASEFFLPMRRLGSYFHIAMNGIAASETIEEILAMDCFKAIPLRRYDGKHQIELFDVSYSYERFDLKNINMTLGSGGFIAVLGESGSGKSTLAKLISGWFPADKGLIKINGEDLYLKDISNELCYIGSDAFIIKGSIRENINLGNTYSDEELRKILDKLQLQHLDLDYSVDERGSNLSGGEKQRIALARAILLDAKFYIFDEFTSSLDAHSEAIAMEIVRELQSKGKSILMISHQVHLIKHADEVIVLENGCIIERGKPSELYALRGRYFNLFEKQREYLDFLRKDKDDE